MTSAWVRRPTSEARPAARKASDITYTPPWKYRTTRRASSPSTVISAVGTPLSAAAVTVTSGGSGCADIAARSIRRCSSTLLPTGKADWRRIASTVSCCSVLTDLSFVGAGAPATISFAAKQVRRHHRDPAMSDHPHRGDHSATPPTESSDAMSETEAKQQSAVVFGARNLGRAVIELLVSDGWAVTGVARSKGTLDGVSAAGALAVKADVTAPASVYGVLEQAADAHGGVDLVVNAAAAYGGERTSH